MGQWPVVLTILIGCKVEVVGGVVEVVGCIVEVVGVVLGYACAHHIDRMYSRSLHEGREGRIRPSYESLAGRRLPDGGDGGGGGVAGVTEELAGEVVREGGGEGRGVEGVLGVGDQAGELDGGHGGLHHQEVGGGG